ncbi:MAG: hypothetical protein ACI8Q1_002199 [Parvicella sp.]|jgi:hypothetical protein
MEHLNHLDEGLRALQRIAKEDEMLSVPRETNWCGLNMLRGKYLSKLGNTLEHIQHCSRLSYEQLAPKYFGIFEIIFFWILLLCRVNENKRGELG